jgi:hypothetical protein
MHVLAIICSTRTAAKPNPVAITAFVSTRSVQGVIELETVDVPHKARFYVLNDQDGLG